MYIAIWAGGMPFNGETIDNGESLGGSETAAYAMAKELVKLKHNVTVYTSSQKTGSWDGVKYEWMGQPSDQYPLGDRFHFVMQAPHDVVIIQRHPLAFVHQYNSKLNIWWLHDLALGRNAAQVNHSLINTDLIFTVSEFHRNQVSEVYGVDKKHIVATTNGIDYSMFGDMKSIFQRKENSLFYTARPERGLENLVKPSGIMENLSECHLYVCGYDNTVPQMRSYYEYLWGRCRELPNVTNLGPLGKKELYEWESNVMLHVYPTEFEDTSCIAALEAQAAGTPFITSQTAALPETLKDGGALLLKMKDGKINQQKFVDTIRRVLKDKNEWIKLHNLAKKKMQTWTSAAEQWNDVFENKLKEKCGNRERLQKHLEHMSDIVILDRIGGNEIPHIRQDYAFMYDDNFAEHYEKYYEYEKSRGVEYGPEDLTGNRRFEAVCKTIEKLQPKSILDYGCAHGHYVMNLLASFPDIKIDGIDISTSNIEKARLWASEAAVDAEFATGTVDDIPDGKTYDVIMVNEVLEHVLNPQELIDSLKPFLNENGRFVCTVPYGPWEAAGYRIHKGWRAHIHHFERVDLMEMFGSHKDYDAMAIPHAGDLGHYLFTFSPTGEASGLIDISRKLTQQAPRETLSVCMILKDAENTIGKTLENIIPYADEFIFGIDASTSDGTVEKIDNIFRDESDKRYKILLIDSPTIQGFDSARNQTIDETACDWILWLDDDETLEQVENLHKYLRNNSYDGYAIKQHHYAVEPAALFKTDYPVRLFRNHQGIKFFGFVHEHPELTMNEGIGKLIILPDLAIMHTGYSTEKIRRERFSRNFPLMQKDREKYPDRMLGKFLWLRDLAHLVRYSMERSGGQITHEMMMQCNEIIQMWRELANGSHVRMCVDSLQYYSEASDILTQGNSIQYSVAVDASKFNGGLKKVEPIVGNFVSEKDIKLLTDKILDEKLSVYEAKYF